MSNELQKINGHGDQHLPAEIKHAALPALIMRTGEKGAYRFLEFFATHIRNPIEFIPIRSLVAKA
jgi:hypothetical protein